MFGSVDVLDEMLAMLLVWSSTAVKSVICVKTRKRAYGFAFARLCMIFVSALPRPKYL